MIVNTVWVEIPQNPKRFYMTGTVNAVASGPHEILLVVLSWLSSLQLNVEAHYVIAMPFANLDCELQITEPHNNDDDDVTKWMKNK